MSNTANIGSSLSLLITIVSSFLFSLAHAKQVAEFAIDAVDAASKIVIDEDAPNKGCVSVRVGFHSGPVVSNVIGSLNPRYGLFGDTYVLTFDVVAV